MSKVCKYCSKKLSLFSPTYLCSECNELFDSKFLEIKRSVLKNLVFSEEQANFLKNVFSKESLTDFYNEIYNVLILNRELKENEITLLANIKDGLNLSGEDLYFESNVKPYIYIDSIKNRNSLPDYKLETFGFNTVLKKSEKIHFADIACLKEIKTKANGYAGSRSGVCFRIVRYVNYRTGSHKGIILTKERLVQFSRGVLVVTNQRVFLNSFPGYKPFSISLDKILSFQAYENGIEIYQEDCFPGYFFEIENIGSVEIFGICLSYLLFGIMDNEKI